MSDIIFSSTQLQEGKLTRHLNQIYPNDKVLEFHGKWGSVGVVVNNLDTNYVSSNNENIIIALGNPFTLKEISKKIDNKLFCNNVDWSNILNGPFLVIDINKKLNNVHIITDLMSFIPVYQYKSSNSIFLSTHIDLLATLTYQEDKKDNVSELDFILNGIITYPYTQYENIKQSSPGTEICINNGKVVCLNQYWEPYEAQNIKDIEYYAKKLNRSISNDVSIILSEDTNSNIAHFISGGEDSRVVSSFLKKTPKDGFIFLDSFNREGKIASKIAEIYNSNLTIKYREPSYYLDILKITSLLLGNGTEYKHAHAIGFVKDCKLDQYNYVLGGLFADAFLKGSRIRKDKLSQTFKFLPQRKSNGVNVLNTSLNFINPVLIDEINKRKKNHLEFVNKYRKISVNEWFYLYPSSMNNNVGNYHVNRKLFNTYEPFLSNEIIKISSEVSQDYKLNRRLFNLSFKQELNNSKFVFHGDGFLPYYPWYINGILHFSIKSYRKVLSKFRSKNQGSWADWQKVLKTNQWNELLEEFSSNNNFDYFFMDDSVTELLTGDKLNIYQKLNFLQVIYLDSIYS